MRSLAVADDGCWGDRTVAGPRLLAGLGEKPLLRLRSPIRLGARPVWGLISAALIILASGGCLGVRDTGRACFTSDLPHFQHVATKMEYPDVAGCEDEVVGANQAPLSLREEKPPEVWNLSLEEALREALSHSDVLRDMGGSVLRAPAATRTIYDPALREADPRFGVEAALAAFDAEASTNLFFENNDRALNNVILGGGTRLLQQDLGTWQTQIRKRAATGTLFALRNNTVFDANNRPGNLFPSAWDTNIEAEIRQPLLRGAGVNVNRIMGPDAVAGVPRGVLVARLNTDVAIADFEIALRDLVSDIEDSYWDLYFSYRDLDAKIAARDASLETWRWVQSQKNRPEGVAWKELQAREQYYRFQEQVQNALSGKLLDVSRGRVGNLGTSFRPTGGVQMAERRLRMLMGIPSSDGRMIRPSDEPIPAPVTFDWDDIAQQAIERRPELRRQKWLVKRQELELLASRNQLLPTLDLVGTYRWRGFGQDLLGGGSAPFADAWDNLATGDFQEWQMGSQLSVPIGYRQAHSAVRYAELAVARERAVLNEQQRQVMHELSNAWAEVYRSFDVAKTAADRRWAAQEQVKAADVAFRANSAPLEVVLDAQTRLSLADSNHYQAWVEYRLALKNMHLAKGSLLDYDQVYLAEGPWPRQAYCDAVRRDAQRGPELPSPCCRTWLGVSQGEYPQQSAPAQLTAPAMHAEPVVAEPIKAASTPEAPGSTSSAPGKSPERLPTPAR